MDVSHYRALSIREIKELFAAEGVEIENALEAVLTHSLEECVGHAHQTEDQLDMLSDIIEAGLDDPAISKFLFQKDKTIYFKRSGALIYGRV